jgi:soluble lytic murein transglycosylase
MENDRLRVATQAVEILNPKLGKTVNEIYLNPGKYLNDKLTAFQPKTREMVSLALIRQAYLDPAEAAHEMGKLRWRAQLTDEERSWLWGVIGKRAAQKMSNDAVDYFARGTASDMHDDHLAWKRAPLCAWGNWTQVLGSHCTPWARPSATIRPGSTGAPARCCGKPRPKAPRRRHCNCCKASPGCAGFMNNWRWKNWANASPCRPSLRTTEPDEKVAAIQNPGLSPRPVRHSHRLAPKACANGTTPPTCMCAAAWTTAPCWPPPTWPASNEVWDRCINTSDRTKAGHGL